MKKTANLTIWFDKNSNSENHLEYLKEILSIKNTIKIGINDILYNKEIGALILKNKEKIEHVTFKNLKIGKEIIVDNNKSKIKSIQKNYPIYILTNEDKVGRKVIGIGEFELVENLKERINCF